MKESNIWWLKQSGHQRSWVLFAPAEVSVRRLGGYSIGFLEDVESKFVVVERLVLH